MPAKGTWGTAIASQRKDEGITLYQWLIKHYTQYSGKAEPDTFRILILPKKAPRPLCLLSFSGKYTFLRMPFPIPETAFPVYYLNSSFLLRILKIEKFSKILWVNPCFFPVNSI